MKRSLRKKYLLIRDNIDERNVKNEIIFNKVINNEMIRKAKLILIYVSFNREVDTINLINYFLNHNYLLAVPKIENNIMNFYYINSLDDLNKGYYNILEPTTNKMVKDFNDAVCITPGVCFSRDGYRIGYGKGFYDKFFSVHNVYAIGLCYQDCLINNIPYDIYDKRVNDIITD